MCTISQDYMNNHSNCKNNDEKKKTVHLAYNKGKHIKTNLNKTKHSIQ